MIPPGYRRADPAHALLTREWLVTNALGGYACGTIGGAATRRFHGLLIAALPAPHSRTMMLNHLAESVNGIALEAMLEEFVLEDGLPVWRFAGDGIRIEKRLVMPHHQNTTCIVWRLIDGPDDVTLELRPSLKFRPHEGLLSAMTETWDVRVDGTCVEIRDGSDLPALRLAMIGTDAHFVDKPAISDRILYSLERDRGYDHEGPLWSPGVIRMKLGEAALIASVEEGKLTLDGVFEAETERRRKLVANAQDDVTKQLTLAADQFLIRAASRAGEERTIIAGYHWFTDWGRDTMISLEGLTLVTGRHREARGILHTFASHIRDGLIPNMFPEGEFGGLYHTADATLWFFHAVKRYVEWTSDRDTLRELLPKLRDIIEHHVRGTRFNIHVDPDDGLLVQGEEGYQLTWMDAKVDGWVVTPRRGKAVEINALFYNALRVLAQFSSEEGDPGTERWASDLAQKNRDSFNERFWFEDGQHLYDVVDPDDPALRPNQIFAIALDYPVLDESRWKQVVAIVEKELVTPVGLRSLGGNHPDYKPYYDGDLRARDAAYHQGTVWGWLIGPFLDAWRKVHPHDDGHRFLEGFPQHLGEACIGTISEVFDAEAPFTPRGCAAQAWSVAEVLRCWRSPRA